LDCVLLKKLVKKVTDVFPTEAPIGTNAHSLGKLPEPESTHDFF
jgi:hypothetical protein